VIHVERPHRDSHGSIINLNIIKSDESHQLLRLTLTDGMLYSRYLRPEITALFGFATKTNDIVRRCARGWISKIRLDVVCEPAFLELFVQVLHERLVEVEDVHVIVHEWYRRNVPVTMFPVVLINGLAPTRIKATIGRRRHVLLNDVPAETGICYPDACKKRDQFPRSAHSLFCGALPCKSSAKDVS
jgi:hypothetical protein